MIADRDAALAWIREAFALYELTWDMVGWVPPQAVRYRNAQGQTWDGVGEMPDWLRRAVAAGQDLLFFAAIPYFSC